MTDPRTPVLLLLVSLLLALLGLRQLIVANSRLGRIVWLATAGDPRTVAPAWHERLDLRLRRTVPGRWLERALRAGGVPLSTLQFVALVVAAAVAVRLAAGLLLPDPAPALASVGTVVAAGLYLQRRRTRRRMLLATQIADVARVLANFTAAGLSLPSAIHASVEELPEPAATEMALVGRALAVGHGLAGALGELRRRMPSRELAVLASTLLILSRSGGDVAHAMRGMSHTLEARREVLDEVNTALSMSKANAWGVVILGLGSVLIIRLMSPDALTLLLSTPIGLLATGIAFALFASGFLVLRRTTRIEV